MKKSSTPTTPRALQRGVWFFLLALSLGLPPAAHTQSLQGAQAIVRSAAAVEVSWVQVDDYAATLVFRCPATQPGCLELVDVCKPCEVGAHLVVDDEHNQAVLYRLDFYAEHTVYPAAHLGPIRPVWIRHFPLAATALAHP